MNGIVTLSVEVANPDELYCLRHSLHEHAIEQGATVHASSTNLSPVRPEDSVIRGRDGNAIAVTVVSSR